MSLFQNIYNVLSKSCEPLTSNAIAQQLKHNRRVVKNYLYSGYKKGIFELKPAIPHMLWNAKDINVLKRDKPLVILDLDHQSHLLKNYANRNDIELWCFHGIMYSGKKAGTCFTSSSLYKESSDYLIGIVLSEYCAKEKLGSIDRQISIITKDAKLANIRDIFKERYGRNIEIKPA